MTVGRIVTPSALALVALLILAGCTASEDIGGTSDAAADTAGATAQSASTVGGGAEQTRGITVVGEGRLRGRPDTVEANVGVEVRRPSVQEALDEANAAAADVIEALQDAGIADDDIQTTNVTVGPQHGEERPGGPPVVEGYVARNTVRVTIAGVDRAGTVLQQALEAAGDAATLDGFTLALRDDDDLVRAARDEAFADARTTAEQYAQLAGRELGPVVAVSEVTGGVPFAGEERALAADTAVPIAPGSQEVAVQVRVTWSLQ